MYNPFPGLRAVEVFQAVRQPSILSGERNKVIAEIKQKSPGTNRGFECQPDALTDRCNPIV